MPFLYKSLGGRLLVATTIQPFWIMYDSNDFSIDTSTHTLHQEGDFPNCGTHPLMIERVFMRSTSKTIFLTTIPIDPCMRDGPFAVV